MREFIEFKCSLLGAAYFRHIKERVKNAWYMKTTDTLSLSCFLGEDNPVEDVKIVKVSKQILKRNRREGGGENRNELDDFLSAEPTKRQRPDPDSRPDVQPESARGSVVEPPVNPYLVPLSEFAEKIDDEKPESQKEEGMGSQTSSKPKSPQRTSQTPNKSTGGDGTEPGTEQSQ